MKTHKHLPKPTKRNSLTISGQLWYFKRNSYWSPCVGGGAMSSAYTATRYSDGRSVTGSTKESLAKVIESRIADGIY